MRGTSAVMAAMAATMAVAHPGEDIEAEILERRNFIANTKHANLGHCAAKMQSDGHERRGIERRSELASRHAKRSHLMARASEDMDKSHLHADSGFTEKTPLSEIFASNASCVLSPEAILGPYYAGGEYIRSDVTESQQGIPLWMDVAVFDVDTCQPVVGKWMEIWGTNALGIYSGMAKGGLDTASQKNLDSTWLRGLQKSDENGAVQFKTIFPGHYYGRTQHVHFMAHTDAFERTNNGTVYDMEATHVGQMYFDQDLSDKVEATSPYTSNNQEGRSNVQDHFLVEALKTSDPIMQYTMLGNDIHDGILAWMSFGINTTHIADITPAAIIYEEGGKDMTGGGGDDDADDDDDADADDDAADN